MPGLGFHSAAPAGEGAAHPGGAGEGGGALQEGAVSRTAGARPVLRGWRAWHTALVQRWQDATSPGSHHDYSVVVDRQSKEVRPSLADGIHPILEHLDVHHLNVPAGMLASKMTRYFSTEPHQSVRYGNTEFLHVPDERRTVRTATTLDGQPDRCANEVLERLPFGHGVQDIDGQGARQCDCDCDVGALEAHVLSGVEALLLLFAEGVKSWSTICHGSSPRMWIESEAEAYRGRAFHASSAAFPSFPSSNVNAPHTPMVPQVNCLSVLVGAGASSR